MFAVLELIGFINIFGVVIYQGMLYSSLAPKISEHLQELGYTIKFNPKFDWGYYTYPFYKARRLNRNLQDPIITSLLKELNGFYIYMVFSFVFLAVIIILDGVLNN